MEQNRIIENLLLFGLTRQEATIYICLIQNHEMSGYEVAKVTGISRSNAYSALSGLTEKGAAYLIEGSTSKYIGVPVEEFCENKIRNMKKVAVELQEHIPKVAVAEEGYITIGSYKNILDKIHNMIFQAEKRLYLSAPEEFIQVIEQDLRTVCSQGMKVVILTNEEVRIPEAKVYRTEKKDKQIRLITDSKYVLTGEITGSNLDTCLFSGQTNFVNVFKEALSNEIKLIQLTKGENKDE